MLRLLLYACRGLALFSSSICTFFWYIFRVLCYRCSGDDTIRQHRAESSHMEWSRKYYYKTSKTRCIQRLLMILTCVMATSMLYFDTEHLPKKWTRDDIESERNSSPNVNNIHTGTTLAFSRQIHDNIKSANPPTPVGVSQEGGGERLAQPAQGPKY